MESAHAQTNSATVAASGGDRLTADPDPFEAGRRSLASTGAAVGER
jgi:hypothetical protein